jgi:hypothetical protein
MSFLPDITPLINQAHALNQNLKTMIALLEQNNLELSQIKQLLLNKK